MEILLIALSLGLGLFVGHILGFEDGMKSVSLKDRPNCIVHDQRTYCAEFPVTPPPEGEREGR